MSAILSAPVPVPVSYCHSPYQLSRGESNCNPSTKDRYRQQAESRAISPYNNHRWSPSSASGDRIAQHSQMKDHGHVSGPQPPEAYHWHRSNSTMLSFPSHSSPNSHSNGGRLKMEDQASHGLGLPPIRYSVETKNREEERKASRSLGVHSILNPTHGEELDVRHRRRSFAQMEEDFKKNPSITNAMLGRTQNGEVMHEATSPPLAAASQRAPRRILTPISPRIQGHRAVRYGQGRQPTGTINAQETPFLSPTARYQSQEASPAPQPSAAQSHSNQPQTQQSPQHSQSGHASQQTSPFLMPAAPAYIPPIVAPPCRPSVSIVHSARASPTPSNYSSFSQQNGVMSGKSSPSPHNYRAVSGPTPPGSYQPSPSPVHGPSSNVPPVHLDGDQQQAYSAMISSGQNYQVLTIDTTRGHMQMPVEVQTASRMSDEKRKKNAGASARFRQRRKEKEKDASIRISNLEQELAWAQEDSRFYKQERDVISDLVLRSFPQYKSYIDDRPASPIHSRDLTRRRLSTHGLSSTGDSVSPRVMPAPTPIMPGPDSNRYEQPGHPPTIPADRFDQTGGERPATRRRTEPFHAVPPPNVTVSGHRSHQPASPSFPSLGGRSPAHHPIPQQQTQPYQQPQARQDQPLQPQLPPIGQVPYRQEPSHEQRSWPSRPEQHRQ